jgi:diamine N-acetyltransferase
MHPFLADLFDRLQELHRDMLRTIAGLPQEALDWVPAREMNSLVMLIAHAAGAERYWIGDVAGQRHSGRDREAEFQVRGLGAAELQGLLVEAERLAREVLEALGPADLETVRTSPRDGRPFTVGWALAHALEHSGTHLGHMQTLRQMWDKWVYFPHLLPEIDPAVSPASTVSLREISLENLFPVVFLSNAMNPLHKHMVAPNGLSIAEAHYADNAWFRAIYAEETPVGFIMLHDSPEGEWGYFLWRLMVAAPYQKMGFARRAIELLIEYVRTRPGAEALGTSCGEGPGSPEGFYRKLGFERDGKYYDDEVGLSLYLE